MMLILSALMAAAIQTAPGAGWTWSLYEGEGPLVLANDIPDTAELRSTFQCQAGSGAVTISVYGEPATAVRAVCILLIVAALDHGLMAELEACAMELGMDVLV